MDNYNENTNIVLVTDDYTNWTCNHSFEELKSISENDWKYKIKLFDDEIWKSGSVAGFSKYHISNYGRIKRLKEQKSKKSENNSKDYVFVISERIITGHLDGDGYIYVSLRNDDNKQISIAIHRLVAFVFCLDNRPEKIEYNTKNKLVVDHINQIKNDNRSINLRWATYSMNGKNVIKDYSNRYDYKNPLTDENASESDLIENVIPNESPRWFTKVNFSGEIWKIVTGYEIERVYVSNYGRIMKPVYDSRDIYISKYYERKKYFLVTLPTRYFEKKQKIFRVHQLVAQEFLNYEIGSYDNDGNKLVIDHIDTNTHNNSVSNLRVCTQKENMTNELTLKTYNRKRNISYNECFINAYEYPSGDFVEQFINLPNVQNYFNIDDNCISKCCRGLTPISYSRKFNKYFIFRYCEWSHIDDRTNLWESDIFNTYDIYNTELFTKNKRGRIFNLYEYPSGNFIKQYDNFKDASDEYKLSINSLAKNIMGENFLAFSRKLKKHYTVRRVDYDNMNNFSNLFDSGLMNIGDKIITKENLEKTYRASLEKYINLYSYPSGNFIGQFSYYEDVIAFFDNKIPYCTLHGCLYNKQYKFSSPDTKRFYIIRYVNEEYKDVTKINLYQSGLLNFPKNKIEIGKIEKYINDGIIDNYKTISNESNIMINQKRDNNVIKTYQNIFEIQSINPEYDIDLIYYSIQNETDIYDYTWVYTAKHNKDVTKNIKTNSRTIMHINKYSIDGQFIEHYDDIYDITPDEYKLNNIRKCARRLAETAYGFIWRETDEVYDTSDLLDIKKPRRLNFLYFSAYDENDNLIESYKSSKIAAEKYGIVVRKIYRMLDKEKYIDYNGQKIKFKRDYYDGLD